MEKTYVFDTGADNMSGLIASLCQNRGLDPNMVMAMMNNRNGDGFGNSAWWIIILLIFGWGGFGNGFGGGFGGRGNAQGLADLGNLVNNDSGRELLMQAISGNREAIGQLSSQLGCNYNSLNGAIHNLSTQLCNLGGQIGLGQKDIIAAIMGGNNALASQLCECCCSTKQLIADFKGDIALQMCNQTNTLQNTVTQLGYDGQIRTITQTNDIIQNATGNTNILAAKIDAQTQIINDKFCQLEMREMQNKIDSLREQNSQLALAASQQAQTANIVSQIRPCPTPAYVVPNPYGCGCNNYPYNNSCGSCNC